MYNVSRGSGIMKKYIALLLICLSAAALLKPSAT